MFNFLKNKIVQYILWAVLIVDIALLIIAGFTQEQISGVLVAVAGIVAAVIALVMMIIKLINKKSEE